MMPNIKIRIKNAKITYKIPPQEFKHFSIQRISVMKWPEVILL